jgi:hypothetical protein
MLLASNKATRVPNHENIFNQLILLVFIEIQTMKERGRGKAATQSGKLLPPTAEQKITTSKAISRPAGRQKTEDRRQKTEDRRQKTEDRRQKTEDRRQKTEDRRQKNSSEVAFVKEVITKKLNAQNYQ